MQTERVTFLTTPDHKAALDAFAADNGKSVGHVVREATAGYIAEGNREADEVKAAVLAEAERALPAMKDDLDAIRSSIADARTAIAAALHEPAVRRSDVAA
jgi:hypothetical protein